MSCMAHPAYCPCPRSPVRKASPAEISAGPPGPPCPPGSRQQRPNYHGERMAPGAAGGGTRGERPSWDDAVALNSAHPIPDFPVIRPVRPPVPRHDRPPGKPARPEDIATGPNGPAHGRRPAAPERRWMSRARRVARRANCRVADSNEDLFPWMS